jgi:hypothetical protein
MPRRAHQEQYAWGPVPGEALVSTFLLMPSTRDADWTEPHLVKVAITGGTPGVPVERLDHVTVLFDVPLSAVVYALMQMAITHTRADTVASAPPSVLGSRAKKWAKETRQLAALLDLRRPERQIMRGLADHNASTPDWPQMFFKTVPRNSRERRTKRLSTLLWALEQLHRAGCDVEDALSTPPASSEPALWRRWRDLFYTQSDEQRPRKLFNRAIDERVSRLDHDIIPTRTPSLMAAVVNVAAIPLSHAPPPKIARRVGF